jgi:FtsH-binding integral membrane protein
MKDTQFWGLFLGGAIVIVIASWYLFGEDIFKFVLSAFLLVIAIVFLVEYVKYRKIGLAVFMGFCVCAALTLLSTLFQGDWVSMVFSVCAVVFLIGLLYTFTDRQRFYMLWTEG